VDWFYVQNGKQLGPVPVAQFDLLVQAGHITPATLVWREGLASWQPLRSIAATGASLPPAPAPPVLPGALTACAECGLTFPQSEMIPFAGSWICAKCKPIYFQRLREGAPLAAGGADAWQSGDAVVTLHGGRLPARCVRCNGTVTGQPIEGKYYWHSQWVYILLFIPLIYLIVYPFVAKRTRVSVPICEECRRRRRMFIGVSWMLVAIGIVVFIVGNFIYSDALEVLAFVIEFAAIVLGFSKGTLFSTKKADGQYVWMRGFCKEYRASLPEFPSFR
jgi:hypothetical protein